MLRKFQRSLGAELQVQLLKPAPADQKTAIATSAAASSYYPTSNLTSVPQSPSPSPSPDVGGLDTNLVTGVVVGAVVFVGVCGMGFFACFKRRRTLPSQAMAMADVGGSEAYEKPYSAGYDYSNAPQSFALPLEEPQPDPTPIGTFTVVSTYTPVMSDELELHPGDVVTLLVEYDDGWCQGINDSRGGLSGVFPKNCISSSSTHTSQPGANLKRMSSLNAGGLLAPQD